ncbi:MAG: tetratricopeptide repeat protein, partial [Deltaproteobacteria bacterium]|nr:tetratricopeptide repeat protein [Deltaproteobacteria bacterium]
MSVSRMTLRPRRFNCRGVAFVLMFAAAVSTAMNSEYASAETSGSDGITEVSSFLDFVPTRAGFPAQLDSVTKPITTALNLIRRDAANSPTTSLAAVAVPREAKALLLSSIERADSIKESTPRGLRDEIFLLEGFAFELLGEPAKAIDAYDESLKLRALNPVVMFRRGMALKLAGDCAKALPQFEEVRWASDKLAHEVMYAEAQCQLLIGRGDLAVSLLEQARKKKPGFTLASKMLLDMRMKAFDASPRSIDSTVAAKMT